MWESKTCLNDNNSHELSEGNLISWAMTSPRYKEGKTFLTAFILPLSRSLTAGKENVQEQRCNFLPQ